MCTIGGFDKRSSSGFIEGMGRAPTLLTLVADADDEIARLRREVVEVLQTQRWSL
jgi:hypothetical protein